MEDNKLIHIKKLGIALNKDNVLNVVAVISYELNKYEVHISFTDRDAIVIKCKNKRHAYLLRTIINKKMKGDKK